MLHICRYYNSCRGAVECPQGVLSVDVIMMLATTLAFELQMSRVIDGSTGYLFFGLAMLAYCNARILSGHLRVVDFREQFYVHHCP